MTGIEQAVDVVVIGLELGSDRYRFAAVADFASRCADEMSRAGLELTVEHDMAAWARHLRSAVATDGVNPTFDPEHNALSPDSCCWLRIRDAAGAVVGCCATRVFHTPDFTELIASMRLWFDPVPAWLRNRRGSLTVLPGAPALAGRVVHSGGLWLRPDYRGRGLVVPLARLTRALAVDGFGAAFDTGFMFRRIAERPGLLAAYGWAHHGPCTAGFFPPTGRDEHTFLGYSERTQLLDLLPRTAFGKGCGGGPTSD